MTLQHISYISRLSDPVTIGDLIADMEHFRTKNLTLGITGCIAFEGERIMQILEGPQAAVDGLFETIRTDPRHREVIELERKPIDRMSFRHWGMVRRPIADVVFLTQLT